MSTVHSKGTPWIDHLVNFKAKHLIRGMKSSSDITSHKPLHVYYAYYNIMITALVTL